VSVEAGWLPDPIGAHQVRYWDGARWTEHVSDGGTTAVDPVPADAPPPPPPVAAPPPPPPPPAAQEPAAPSGGGGWKDKLKNAAQQAANQGKAMAEQAKTTVGEQQAKRTEQWANDPNTVWFGSSQNLGGMSKATYRITRDRVWIESGLLGVKSESVPLWSVKDLDVRQNLMQRGKDIGDVVLVLEDASYGVDTGNTLSFSGMAEPGATTTGQVVLDNIEGPYNVRELLWPLISEARQKKLMERQSQYIHVNPGMQAATGMGMAAPSPPPAPAAPAGPPVDLADQLRKLATLRDEGILSEEEFAAQKAKLLGG
jgi:Protein of unknown function (DUF2510)/Bacterial PH domain/Short C-terminal domain